MSLIQLSATLAAVSAACSAAYKTAAIIYCIPDIDPDIKNGIIHAFIDDSIKFKNGMFKYPSRLDFIILKKNLLKITPVMTVAFIGPSGSGKSTIVQLLQRFYDFLYGSVTLDG